MRRIFAAVPDFLTVFSLLHPSIEVLTIVDAPSDTLLGLQRNGSITNTLLTVFNPKKLLEIHFFFRFWLFTMVIGICRIDVEPIPHKNCKENNSSPCNLSQIGDGV